MLKLTEGTLNLPITIGTTLMNFGRMKRFQPVSAVVNALRESKLLEVTGPEGAEQVKRKVPWDGKIAEDESLARSVYVKGFGDEDDKGGTDQFSIEAFFAEYGPTRQVRLRRVNGFKGKSGAFKGSVFVEFEDQETAQKFLNLDPKPLWKGHPLDIKAKKLYVEGKNAEIRSGDLEPQRSYQNSRTRGSGGRGGSRGVNREFGNDREGRPQRNNRDRDDHDRNHDKDDWNKRRDDDRANGHKNDRRGGKRGGRGGRGGRGDRGGRRDRDDRGPRNDRNHERGERNG
jgi:lupus La protein